MAYKRGIYDLTIDSSFTPFTLQEMMTPFLMYKDAYEKDEAAFVDLTDKADKFKYLSETLPEGSKSRQLYEGYANELSRQAADLAQNGLSMNNRRALTNLKRRYQGEIGRLALADEAMQEEKKLRRANKDTSMLYATDNLNIDSFLDGQTPNLYSISGEDLRKEAAQYAQAASSRIYGDTRIENINKYFQDIIQTQGYSPEVLSAWRQNLQSIPEFNQAVDDIMAARGVTGNLTGANLERARQNIINGIMEGSAYQEKRTSHQNPGVLTAAQAASNALGWANHNESVRQHNMQVEMAGYEKDASGNWIYNPDKDVTLKKAEAVAKAKGTKTTTDQSGTKKTSKVDLLENESYDTKTDNSGPAPSGQNATYGKEISLAQAMEEAPDLVAATGEMRNYYRYYKNGSKITRRRVHSSVTPDTEEESAQPTGGTTTGNGSNHNAL